MLQTLHVIADEVSNERLAMRQLAVTKLKAITVRLTSVIARVRPAPCREPNYGPRIELVANYPSLPDAKRFGLPDIGNIGWVSHHSVPAHRGTTRYVRLLDLVRPKNVKNHFARGEKIV